MHLLGLRRSLAEAHPWLPAALLKAFEPPSASRWPTLPTMAAAKTTLPFVEEHLLAARNLMGRTSVDGLDANRHVLEGFQRHHAEGLSSRLLSPEELFIRPPTRPIAFR